MLIDARWPDPVEDECIHVRFDWDGEEYDFYRERKNLEKFELDNGDLATINWTEQTITVRRPIERELPRWF